MELQVHIEDIEVQHRRLAGLIDKLMEAIEQHRPQKNIREAFEDLLNYLELHLSDEEEFMRRFEYPELLLKAHQAEHVSMLDSVRGVRDLHETSGMGLSVPDTLRQYLDHHEDTHDSVYLDYFRAQAGMCDGTAAPFEAAGAACCK